MNRSLIIYKTSNLKCLRHIALVLLTFTFYTSTTIAQPSWSRGEQLLSITFQEAMLRADAALKAEGFVNLQTQANIVTGYKESNTAIILCNEAPNAKQWINIVVSSLSNDGSVPGADRVNLQKRMEGTAQNAISIAGTWNALKWIYEITQNGKDFIWKIINDPNNKETAVGEVFEGNQVKAAWTSPSGSSSSQGTVIIENGKAIRIEWANGVVFTQASTSPPPGMTINGNECGHSNRYALSITPNAAKPGETVKVRLLYPGGRPGDGDWIGCFYPQTRDSYTGFWSYVYKIENCEYDFVVPNINPGIMQFRYILEAGYDKIMTTADFNVL